jgi:hypothetical protein
MPEAHAALAWPAALAIAVLLAVAALEVVRPRGSYRAIDLALMAQLVATGFTALAGVGVAILAQPPRDPLHLLYGAVVLVVPGVARVAGHRRGAGAVARWVAAGSLVALGATVRSFMTGS